MVLLQNHCLSTTKIWVVHRITHQSFPVHVLQWDSLPDLLHSPIFRLDSNIKQGVEKPFQWQGGIQSYTAWRIHGSHRAAPHHRRADAEGLSSGELHHSAEGVTSLLGSWKHCNTWCPWCLIAVKDLFGHIHNEQLKQSLHLLVKAKAQLPKLSEEWIYKRSFHTCSVSLINHISMKM